MTDNSRKYPLIEVITEFHLPPGAWRDDLPDLLYEKLKGELPNKRTVEQFQMQTTVGAAESTQSYKKWDRQQLVSESGNRLVQIDQTLLAVNHVQPYTCWEEYSALVTRSVDALIAIIGPVDFAKVVLQYINKFDIPKDDFKLDEHFLFRPLFDGAFIQCGCVATQPWEEEDAIVSRQMQTQNVVDNCVPIIFTLNAQRRSVAGNTCIKWLDSAHQKLNNVFKASITGKTLKLHSSGKGT